MTLNDIGDYLRPCTECRVFDNMHLLSLVQDLVDKKVKQAILRERRKHKAKP